MSNHTFLSSFWEGFHIVKSHQTASLIKLTLKPNSIARCPCGLKAQAIHEYQWRNVKEATLLGTPVELSVQTRRIKCSHCGIKTERLSWLEPYDRITNRLRSYIEQLLPLLPIKHIAQVTGVHWHTIKEIDKRRLQQVVLPVKWGELRQLVMDEFAIFKGHRYATVIADAKSHQVMNESGIKPLKEFARKLRPYLHRNTASASYPLNTCTLEGINSKIKLIKRMGYGYRDTDYFKHGQSLCFLCGGSK